MLEKNSLELHFELWDYFRHISFQPKWQITLQLDKLLPEKLHMPRMSCQKLHEAFPTVK